MSNSIHKTCIIEGDVRMGEGNQILPNTIIWGPTTIGNNNIIGPNVVIGSPGQDTRNPRYDSSNCRIEIGSDNIIREFTAIQKPCYRSITKIGNRVFFMQSVHIPHDAVIHDDVVITPMCVLAGITTLLPGVNLAMGVTVHQYSVIGHYSLVAMGAAVTKNIRPFSIYVPGKPQKPNLYALKKFGLENFQDEVSKYVLEKCPPKSQEIGSIVSEFEKLHIDSKRALYE